MSKNNIVIREVQPNDNGKIEQIIKAAFIEYKIPLTGTAIEDKELSQMYESYQGENEVYFVIEQEGNVLGGGGIKALKGADGSICELQKMYFSPEIRGKGFGNIMFNKCLKAAKSFGYKQCYLESASQLKAAIHIYENNGFKHLNKAIGNTGHFSCGVWMIKDL